VSTASSCTTVRFRGKGNRCSTPEVMQQLIRDHCLAGIDVKASSQESVTGKIWAYSPRLRS
jgi:hypothetical protein